MSMWVLLCSLFRHSLHLITLAGKFVGSTLDRKKCLDFRRAHFFHDPLDEHVSSMIPRGTKTTHYREGERDLALFMCGKSSRAWSQTSLIPSLNCSFSYCRGRA